MSEERVNIAMTDSRGGLEKQPASWGVCICASREAPDTLMRVLEAVIEAAARRCTVIDVVLNGAEELSRQLLTEAEQLLDGRTEASMLRIWSISHADKANAINQYIHHIWPDTEVTFFADGYAAPEPTAFEDLDCALREHPEALAAAAVPTHGRCAQSLSTRMQREGGLHGNLHAVARAALNEVRRREFHLPVGLYRVDGVFGAALYFRMAPDRNRWDRAAIVVVPRATWRVLIESPGWAKLARNLMRRRIRQAQGLVENRAIRDLLAVQRWPVSKLPVRVADLVRSWMRRHPWRTCELLVTHPLVILALPRLLRTRPVQARDLHPVLIGTLRAPCRSGERMVRRREGR